MAFLEKKIDETKDDKYKQQQYQLQLDKVKIEQDKATESARRFDITSGQRAAELKARTEGKYYAPRTTTGAKKTRYTDKYYELSGNSPAVINEFAKITGGYAVDDDGNLKRPLSATETERLSNTLIKRMFKEDAKTGELVPIPGMENYIDDLSNSIERTKAKQTEISDLETKQYEKTQDANRWQKKTINEEYLAKIDQAEAELEQIKSDTRNLMEGNIPATSQPTSTSFMETVKEFQTK